MNNGGVWITITWDGSQYSFAQTSNTTGGAVTFATAGQSFGLKADLGIYAFIFTASGFQFSGDAVTWADPGANRNLTWMLKDHSQFAISNINFVTNDQSVVFTINPDNSGGQNLPPIDPTVLNVPDPGGVLAIAA